MTDSLDHDEMACYEPSHLDLYCLQTLNVLSAGMEGLMLSVTSWRGAGLVIRKSQVQIYFATVHLSSSCGTKPCWSKACRSPVARHAGTITVGVQEV